MAITVQWLLTQDTMKGFTLIAGDTSLNTAISGINIMDNPDTVPWLSPGALILSTGYFFTDKAFTENLIQNLVEKGCSGLGIKMNRYLKELPESMLKQAEKLHFPIIDIPFSSSMDQIANLVYRRLYEDEMSETQRLSVLYKDISECVLKKQKLSKLLPLISTAANGSVFLTNDSFEIIGYALSDKFPFAFPFPFCKDPYTLFSEADISYLKNNLSEDQHLPVITHSVSAFDTDLNFQIFPLTNRNTLLGFLILLRENDSPVSSYDFIMNIRSILCIALMNHSILTESERSSRDIFFYNLLSGNLKTEQEIEPLCLQNHFDFKKKRLCIVLRIPEYENMTIAKRRAYERKLFSLFDEVLEVPAGSIIKTVFQTNFILFVYINSGFSQKEAAEYGITISEKLVNVLHKKNIIVSAGISKYASGASTIYSCYMQALQSLEIGILLHPKGNCFSYFADQIYHLLVKHYTSSELQELYDEYLGILERYDEENQAELMLTLSTYLKCFGNITQTAKELFIHRNTMFYRLDQIKSLLHIDFENEDDIHQIRTGFYIRKLLKKY